MREQLLEGKKIRLGDLGDFSVSLSSKGVEDPNAFNAEPVLNGFVFPDILQGATHKADKRKRISQENSNVQDRVIKICEDVLHWEVRPSGTWCRHSYGTNLTHAKVEDRYISQSMGHATDKTITERYIAQYPLETMFEFNSKLLDLEPKMTEEDVKNMTEEEKTEMLLKLLANK